jgi:hypothetical protein
MPINSAPSDPGPAAAALVALIVAVMYAEGGLFRPLATIIILAVLITPPGGGKDSVISGLLKFLNDTIAGAYKG